MLRAFPKTGTGQPAAEATVAEQTVLSEVLALRTILINTIYDLATGDGMTPERMRELIAIDRHENGMKVFQNLQSVFRVCRTSDVVT